MVATVLMLAVVAAGATASVPAADAATAPQWVTGTLTNEPGWGYSHLNGVSCLSATSCVAVGRYGLQSESGQALPLVATYQDAAWTFTPLPEPPGLPAGAATELNAVSCVTLTSCVAVGDSLGPDDTTDTGFAEVLSEGDWVPVTNFGSGPASSSLNGVSCTSATSCVAVGPVAPTSSQSVIATLSGSTWSTQTPPVPAGAAVSCPTPSYCLAVGGGDSSGSALLADVYDGSSWSTTTLPLPGSVDAGSDTPVLTAVSCWAAGECLVGGNAAIAILPYPPESFTIVYGAFADVLSGSTATAALVTGSSGLSGISCTSATFCAAVTAPGGGPGAVVTYIDGAWATAQGDASSGDGVSCTPPGCMAVGGFNGTDSTFSRTLGAPFVGIAATPDDQGYWLANQSGGVWNYGNAVYNGSLGDITLNQPVVGIASTPSGGGYWEDAADGGVFSFGDAPFYGSTGGIRLNQPMVGMAALPNGQGYWLLAADGGIFAFGAAPFYGSVPGVLRPGQSLNKPIVGMASTPDGRGYWLVASDGGVFSFGDAAFMGSMGGRTLNQPVVGMAADPLTGGYWEVAADGGVFAFDAPFYGSTGGITLNQPVTAMEASPTGLGYRFIARDGGVFSFGDSSFFGSPP